MSTTQFIFILLTVSAVITKANHLIIAIRENNKGRMKMETLLLCIILGLGSLLIVLTR
jgi:hypothetical protein